MMQTKMEIEQKFSQCGKYNIIKTLGFGFHAKVKLGECDGIKVAIKIFKKKHDTAKNIKALANEINILKQINHPNLVNLIEFYNALPYRRKNGQTEPCVCIILELAQGGELYEYIASSGRFTQETSRFYFKQLLAAIIYMTNKGICHRDLKLENILLDKHFNLKVADFGFAKVMEATQLRTVLGTHGYMAPEIEAKKEYNGTKVDIFSAGVILFILHTGSPPFKVASNDDNYFNLLIKNQWDKFWHFHLKNLKGMPEFFPQDFRNLIQGMLAPNPDQRFNLEQILQHPWVNGPTATLEQIQNEFRKRQERVEAEILASKLKKMAEKEAEQAKAQKRQIGDFRDYNIIGETEQENFTEIITQHNLLFSNRLLTQGKHTGLTNEIILYQDPKFVFCYLLKYCQYFTCKVTSIHETKYKIDFESIDQQEETEETVKFSLEILDYGDEMINLNLTKLSGDYFKYKVIISRIKEALKKNYNQYLKEEEQLN